MEKEGMTEKEIRKKIALLKPEEKIRHIKNYIERAGMLKPATRKTLYSMGIKIYEKEGGAKGFEKVFELYKKLGKSEKEALLQTAIDAENKALKESKGFGVAADLYAKLNTKEGYAKAGEIEERSGKEYTKELRRMHPEWATLHPEWVANNCVVIFEAAAKYYEKAGMIDKAEENYERSGFVKKTIWTKPKTLDNVVTSIMLLSGMGILYMLFSKAEVPITSGQLLAPPFPNYWIYIFPLIFIAGAIYLLWKKAEKDFGYLPF